MEEKTKQYIACPRCRGEVHFSERVLCRRCGQEYPIIDSVPIMIDEKASIFSINDIIRGKNIPLPKKREHIFLRRMSRMLPSPTKNFHAKQSYQMLKQKLLECTPHPVVLIIGGGIMGVGTETILSDERIQCIETDVYLGPRTQLVCDAHALAIGDSRVDAVIIQAVLEHLVDPFACVQEIHRVLRMGGVIYSEVPFMQQVHLRQYDFYRFSDLGHRVLFKHFEEIDRGIAEGPAVALVWSIRYFCMSFLKGPFLRKFVGRLIDVLFFWIKYFDYTLIHRKESYGAASGFYFLGRKTGKTYLLGELLETYRGEK
jgi:uncharacterized protein YbaR (Trm112 family)/SAM-dependent methyltransferase